MECPHCHRNIPGKDCRKCGAEIPTESRYCMQCGAEIEPEGGAAVQVEDEFDIENRILCPDGTCTGIIIDGKCVECGRVLKEEE
jgi:hypothetical protein